jgi:hypothetical protein
MLGPGPVAPPLLKTPFNLRGVGIGMTPPQVLTHDHLSDFVELECHLHTLDDGGIADGHRSIAHGFILQRSGGSASVERSGPSCEGERPQGARNSPNLIDGAVAKGIHAIEASGRGEQ